MAFCPWVDCKLKSLSYGTKSSDCTRGILIQKSFDDVSDKAGNKSHNIKKCCYTKISAFFCFKELEWSKWFFWFFYLKSIISDAVMTQVDLTLDQQFDEEFLNRNSNKFITLQKSVIGGVSWSNILHYFISKSDNFTKQTNSNHLMLWRTENDEVYLRDLLCTFQRILVGFSLAGYSRKPI